MSRKRMAKCLALCALALAVCVGLRDELQQFAMQLWPMRVLNHRQGACAACGLADAAQNAEFLLSIIKDC